MKEKLLEELQNDNELEASKILQDFAMRWFVFGMGVGAVVSFILLKFIV